MEDSRWAKRAWDDPLAQSRYAPVVGSQEEAKTLAALDSIRTPGPMLQLMSQAPVQPRLTGQPRRALSLTDVVAPVATPMSSVDFSGQPGGFMGSLRNVLTPFG